jgi:hypothetical protein
MIVEVMNSLLGFYWLHQRFGAGTVPGGVMVASFLSKSGSLAMFRGNAPGFILRQRIGGCLPAWPILEIDVCQLLAAVILHDVFSTHTIGVPGLRLRYSSTANLRAERRYVVVVNTPSFPRWTRAA